MSAQLPERPGPVWTRFSADPRVHGDVRASDADRDVAAEAINAAFTPTAEEVEHARAVVAAFAANPGVGALQLDGRMIDAPHLKAAEKLLARAGDLLSDPAA